jgi:hypothetical protein
VYRVVLDKLGQVDTVATELSRTQTNSPTYFDEVGPSEI